ncbi:MAG: hypothetical protein Q7V19_03485, partial [Bacteroidales bacterium]|nr:hypothetical protein [Bacteroidales bacterium]
FGIKETLCKRAGNDFISRLHEKAAEASIDNYIGCLYLPAKNLIAQIIKLWHQPDLIFKSENSFLVTPLSSV